LRKERKERKFMGRREEEEDESGDHFLKRESMCNSLVLKRTEKQICSGYKNLLGNIFSPS
jgi:hypothetical protein